MTGTHHGGQRSFRRLTALVLAGLLAPLTAPAGLRVPGPSLAVDRNPDPGIFETDLVAEEREVQLGENGPSARMYAYNGDSPGPIIRVKVGDRVRVHFTNRLPDSILVHWHGIELHNASDGTTLTQDPVRTGQSYTWDFRVPRPGIFWYHSHFRPTNPHFRGLFGALIVEDPAERELVARRVLPDEDHTATLLLHDVTVCRAAGSNDAFTFAPGAGVPWVFTRAGLGDFPGNTAYPTPKDLCESPREDGGLPLTGPALPAGAVPNIQPRMDCGARYSCRTNEGQFVLANGRLPAGRAGTPEKPGRLGGSDGVMDVRAGEGIRLRLVNAAVSRYFRLRLTDERGRQVMLYRVGGEGGLLDRIRLEGGTQGKLDTDYDPGEIMLSPADRADVVLTVPEGRAGEVLTLWTEDYRHYGTTEYPYGYGGLPSVPVAHLRITGKARRADRRSFQVGDPLRVHPAVDAPIEDLRSLPVKASLLDPKRLPTPLPGTSDPKVLLTVVGLRESMDGIHGTAMHADTDDYRKLPHLGSSRYARLGDLLELTFHNGTQQHHPVHLHGFSFQPVRLLDANDEVLYEYDYSEFIDNVDVPDTAKLVVRVRLEDRPLADGVTPGGGVGRWMLHCHILNHAEIGMMSELVVLP